jgi:hypothetical protein
MEEIPKGITMTNRYIDVYGPNREGEFVATLSAPDTRLVRYWEDLCDLKEEWAVDEVSGDLLNLMRRSRHPEREFAVDGVAGVPTLV